MGALCAYREEQATQMAIGGPCGLHVADPHNGDIACALTTRPHAHSCAEQRQKPLLPGALLVAALSPHQAFRFHFIDLRDDVLVERLEEEVRDVEVDLLGADLLHGY